VPPYGRLIGAPAAGANLKTGAPPPCCGGPDRERPPPTLSRLRLGRQRAEAEKISWNKGTSKKGFQSVTFEEDVTFEMRISTCLSDRAKLNPISRIGARGRALDRGDGSASVGLDGVVWWLKTHVSSSPTRAVCDYSLQSVKTRDAARLARPTSGNSWRADPFDAHTLGRLACSSTQRKTSTQSGRWSG
jgi:hypothetical protein